MFLGAPQMPHYKKKGSVSGLHFTNQDCVIRDNNGKCYLKFPHFHGDYLPIGYVSGSLKEVRVRPYYSDFLVIVFMKLSQQNHYQKTVMVAALILEFQTS